MQGVFKSLVKACEADGTELPILEVRDVKKVTIVLVTGDRGLCGGFNGNIIKAAQKRINRLKEQGIESQLVLVGRKGEQWFLRRPTPIAGTYPLGNSPQPAIGSSLANFLIAQFLSGESDATEIIYSRFINLITCEPSIRTLLPLSLSGIESEEDEIFRLTSADGKMSLKKEAAPAVGQLQDLSEYIFEDEPVALLNTMLTLYFSATLMRCMQESIASELASRMTAMQSASNNAKKIAANLSQIYNRARQSSVTQEMLEIVGGAASLAESG
jgi:F-type H+-transporting ATPase subunit gamma